MTVLTCLISGLRHVVKGRDPSVALETELRDAAPLQLSGIGGSVRFMAGHTTVEFPGWVRKDKRPRFLAMAIDAGAALRKQVEAALAVLTVHGVAVGTVEVSGAVAVSEGHFEFAGHGLVTVGAEIERFSGEEMPRPGISVAGRVAVDACHTETGVCRIRDFHGGQTCRVTAHARRAVGDAPDVVG